MREAGAKPDPPVSISSVGPSAGLPWPGRSFDDPRRSSPGRAATTSASWQGWSDGRSGNLGTGVGLGRQSAPFCLASYPHRGHDPGRLRLSGQLELLALDLQGRLRHIHIVGPTGYGKSWLLIQMVLQDIAAGRSTLVLDPKGDLCREILMRIPEGQRGNVVVMSPGDPLSAVGINPLWVSSAAQAETAVRTFWDCSEISGAAHGVRARTTFSSSFGLSHPFGELHPL